ncbi:DMT family transporter [Paenibacillus sp. YN15]|uniref:DMT family transporter n=1 Tax=Paenibacillus sp. YN15 TaxID=1742774 RepID=UPI000DCBE24E|nr:DMT family transporter [Paenibacillus sp. YN15]RAU93451.1 EamA-like transporter family protein [Paenibacillus sp. YN15]
MAIGILMAALAGGLVGLQNIFNNRVHVKAGLWVTTTLVLGMGFLPSFVIGLASEGTGMFRPGHVEPWYFFSGLIGVGVVTCMVRGTHLLGPTYAAAVAMVSQLGFAVVWDTLGWFGLEKVPFTGTQLLGVLVIAAGIVVFKLGGRKPQEARSGSRRKAAPAYDSIEC